MSDEYIPKVNVAKELSEISRDFTHPRELVRELLSNSLDASASNIYIEAILDDSDGEEELIVRVRDDGVGMSRRELEGFFDLGRSTKRHNPNAIGEKGHGTKITYNSSAVIVTTRSIEAGAPCIRATMNAPLKTLNKAVASNGDPPKVHFEVLEGESSLPLEHGTIVEVRGYDRNNQNAFAHGPLKDYVQWFTAWGRIDSWVRPEPKAPCKLFLQGVGEDAFETVPYGHPFPPEDTDFRQLRSKDPRRPENHFVKRFYSGQVQVHEHPNQYLEVFFSLEGDTAKRDHNEMLKKRGRKGTYKYDQYRYGVQERYGIYLCKDYIPIERKNEQFSTTSAWTKWHAFINCQAFNLTANRSSVENTNSKLLEAIYRTARAYIEDSVLASDEYEKFAQSLQIEEGRRKAEKERAELSKRRSQSGRKPLYVVRAANRELRFLEPRNEQEVTWLLAQLWTTWPEKFPWIRILDHDARFGYDMLVERKDALTGDISSTFVELKHTLRDSDDFNHSFESLWLIVCWKCRLTPEDTDLRDIQGKRREFKIGRPNAERLHTRAHLACPDGGNPIEVFALEQYLKEVLGMESVPVA